MGCPSDLSRGDVTSVTKRKVPSFMKILFIVIIALGAIAIFEGFIYRMAVNPMGFHPARGTAIIIGGIVFVIIGIGGFILRSRRSSVNGSQS
jgi:hypothetical protein